MLTQLHSVFQATPFLPPSTGIHLLDLVMHLGQETHHLGPFSQILQGDAQLDVPVDKIKSANVQLNRTSQFNLDLGFRLLDGIFSGFDLKMEPVKAVLKGDMQMAISFQNVRSRRIPHTVMGTALEGKRVKMEHSSVKMMKREKLGCYIVSSLLESKKFSIHLTRSSGKSLGIEAPSIDGLVEAGLQVSSGKKTDLTIWHEGSNYLTFAFSCFELEIQDSGIVNIWKEVNWARGKGMSELEDELQQPEECDPLEVSFMHPKLPAILAWDSSPTQELIE
mgnify:CR=1 FL=1